MAEPASRRDPQTGVNDVTQLLTLTEESVMQNTMVRFSRDEIYTFVGSVLLAINPYKLIGSLYGEDVMATFETTSLVDAPPHVYAVVENCFRRAIHGSGSQSLIIGGESGAGKTESTKLALSYLVWRTRRQAKADGSAYAGFMACILQANPLMEAFGNVMAHCALDMDVYMHMCKYMCMCMCTTCTSHMYMFTCTHVQHVHMYTCTCCMCMYMSHVHVALSSSMILLPLLRVACCFLCSHSRADLLFLCVCAHHSRVPPRRS